MKFTLHVTDEKAPFFLELIQQFNFVKLDKMEADDAAHPSDYIAKQAVNIPKVKEVENLQTEIDEFFG